jgi:farnesyl diphosphate synthase
VTAVPAQLAKLRARVETALDRQLPPADLTPGRLHEAMRYAVLGGGKRVRPVLVYGAGLALGVAVERLDGPACAVELIHAYSLVHDDLPAMDDDDLRRGRPTCHKAFDEATAILAGDALQALAFRILAHDGAMIPEPEVRLWMVDALATAAGSRGMVGGQAIDLAAIGRRLESAELELMHIHKTGALIRASVLLGALSSGRRNSPQLEALDHYGKCVGLAFQIQDDVLDVVGDSAVTGKRQGADSALDKPTYVSVLGLAEARERARTLSDEALDSLRELGSGAELLRWLARFIVERVS